MKIIVNLEFDSGGAFVSSGQLSSALQLIFRTDV